MAEQYGTYRERARTDQRVKRELELLEAEAKVPPEIRRRIVNDHIGMWLAAIAFLIVAHFVFG
jgi:hypothetical protein